MTIPESMKQDPEIKLTRKKIILFYKDGFFRVENTANPKNRTVTQSDSFESALEAFLSEGR